MLTEVFLPLHPPSPILQFILKFPIYVYFITIYCNSGFLVGFCKFYCCTPIKLLRMRASVKLMKCKCQSFCLPLFFIFSPLVHEHMSATWQHWKHSWISNSLLHELTVASCLVNVHFLPRIWYTCVSTGRMYSFKSLALTCTPETWAASLRAC